MQPSDSVILCVSQTHNVRSLLVLTEKRRRKKKPFFFSVCTRKSVIFVSQTNEAAVL